MSRGVSAHVADHHRIGTRQFGREISHVDAVILAHLHQHRHAIRMDDRGGHGSEVKAGISTLAPRGKSSALSDRNSAAEQDETAIA